MGNEEPILGGMNSQMEASSSRSLWLYLGFGFLAASLGIVLGYLVFELDNPLLIVASVVAIVFALTTVANAEFGLLVLVVMVYTRASDVLVKFHNAPSVLRPYILLLVVAVILNWVRGGRVAATWLRPATLVVAYGTVIFSSLIYATDFQVALNAAVNFLKDGIITVIVVILLNRGRIFKWVMWSLIATGIFLGSISAFQGLTGNVDNTFWGFGQVGLQNIVGETEGSRLAGPVGDPNFYAQAMLVIIPLAVNRMVKEKKWILKGLAAWSFAASSLAVVFSYSRGAAVAVLIMALFYMLHSPPRLSDALLGLIVILILITFVPNPYIDRLATLPDVLSGRAGVLSDVSYRGRASEVIAAWQMFLDHPLVGVGVENYPVFYQQYSRKLGLDARIEQRQAHSLYLQVAAETGLAGILVFGFLLYVMMRGMNDAWKRLKNAGLYSYADMALAFSAGVVGYLGAALFIHAAYPRYFWLLAGISLAIPNVADSLIADGEEQEPYAVTI